MLSLMTDVLTADFDHKHVPLVGVKIEDLALLSFESGCIKSGC